MSAHKYGPFWQFECGDCGTMSDVYTDPIKCDRDASDHSCSGWWSEVSLHDIGRYLRAHGYRMVQTWGRGPF